MKAVRRASAAIALALLLAGCGGGGARKPDPGPTRQCPGCHREIIDESVAKCPDCDTPLRK